MTVACAASDVIHALNLFPSLMWSCPPFLYPAALAIMPDKLETLQSRTELKYRFSRCCLGMISFRTQQMRCRGASADELTPPALMLQHASKNRDFGGKQRHLTEDRRAAGAARGPVAACFVLSAERYSTPTSVCVTPEIQMNPNAGFHHRLSTWAHMHFHIWPKAVDE